MALIKCPKCGMDLNDDCMIVWKCAECGKAFKVSLSKLYKIQELKKQKADQHLIKCSSCGHPLDDGNEKIVYKCSSCENVLRGNLAYFVGKNNVDIDSENLHSNMVECPECGKKILSDSNICSYCGFPLIEEKKNLIKCPECGKGISNKARQCSHCGYEIKKEKRIRKLPIAIGIVLTFFILIIAIYINNSNLGYFDNNKWGISYDEIKNKYGEDISESYLNKEALAMYKQSFNGIEGIYVMIQFEFDKDDKLDTVLLMVSNADSNMTDSEVYSMVIEGLEESYGEAKDVDYGLSWETKKSIIAAKQYPGSTDMTMIMYNKRGD